MYLTGKLTDHELQAFEQYKINPKKLPIGDVVYYVDKKSTEHKPGSWHISYGIVEEHYQDAVCLRLIVPLDMRGVDGIPIKDFVTPTKWKKLPKGWTYSTRLFEVSELPQYAPQKEMLAQVDITNPASIKSAYEKGALVDVRKNDPCFIDDEIDNRLGWRLVRKYNVPYGPKMIPQYISVPFPLVYPTYAEAELVVQENEDRLKRISEMTDLEWSIHCIEETLSNYEAVYCVPAETVEAYRKFLLGLDHVEDVEVRIAEERLQWKYARNKKWMAISL